MSVAPQRPPLASEEAEQAVLGSMLLDGAAALAALEMLRPDDFYAQAHRHVFSAIADLHARGEGVDLVTLSEELRRRGHLEDVGGVSYLAELAAAVPSSAHVQHYARIVSDKATLRELARLAGTFLTRAQHAEDEPTALLNQAQQELNQLVQRRPSRGFAPLREVLDRTLDQIEFLYHHKGQITGVPTGFGDLDSMTAGLQPSDLIIVAARPSMGKCVAAHTRIVDPDTGERLTAAEWVRQRRGAVMAVDEHLRLSRAPVSAWIDDGIKPCYRVTTRTGRQVEVTLSHPFLTVTGWRPLADLKVGDRIAVPRTLPVFGRDDSMSPEEVRLLAYFIAEGNLTQNSPRFTNTDPVILDDFLHCLRAVFPGSRVYRRGIDWSVTLGNRRPQPIRRWLAGFGLDWRLAKEKFVPTAVFRLSKPLLAEFLRVLISCDGSLCYSPAGRPRLEFAVAAPRLADDVQHLLLRFGILSYRRYMRKGYTASQGHAASTRKFDSWRVDVTSYEHVRRYVEEIGWIGEKATRAEVAAAGGMTSGAVRHRDIGRERLAAYARLLESPVLARLAENDVLWDEIVAIESAGEQQVYDLTVPGLHNFVAEDIFVHNTAFVLNMARYAAVEKKKHVGFFSLEMGAEQLAMRLLAAEATVDSQRLRTGQLTEDHWRRLGHALARLSEAPLFIDDTPNIPLVELRARARRLQQDQGLDLLLIDYLQLMSAAGSKAENRQQEISEISRSLKALARELKVPIVALSQLSRSVESRNDKHPMLSDLRECLTGDSLVALASGELRPIADLVGETPDVITLRGWRVDTARAARVWKVGERPVFRLTTRTGRTIRATANHPFRQVNGWTPLADLKPGDRIAIPRKYASAPGIDWEPERFLLLGHLIGDGSYIPRQPLRYISQSEENLRAVTDAAHNLFGFRASRSAVPGATSLLLSAGGNRWQSNPCAEWLRNLGVWGQRSYQKQVPACVLQANSDQIGLFLRHLWATDGCVHVKDETKKVTVYYSTNSETLAKQVQHLLARVGVYSLVSKHQKGSYRPGYQVRVEGGDNQLVFAKNVGAFGLRVHAMNRAMDLFATRSAYTSLDTLPREIWRDVRRRMTERGVTTRAMARLRGTAYGGSSHFKFCPSRGTLAEYAELLADGALRELALGDVLWDQVRTIEPDGMAEVYDMEVPGTHCFVANGIVVHNSGAIEQDADLVAFLYRDDYYNPETDKPNIAEVLIAKQRNGPTGKVELLFMKEFGKFVSIDRQHRDG